MTREEWLQKFKGKKLKFCYWPNEKYFIPKKFHDKYDHIIIGITELGNEDSWGWNDRDWELHPDQRSPQVSATQTPQASPKSFKGTIAEFLAKYRGKKMEPLKSNGSEAFVGVKYLIPTGQYDQFRIKTISDNGGTSWIPRVNEWYWREMGGEKAANFEMCRENGQTDEQGVANKCTCTHSFLVKGCTCGAITTYKMKFS